MQTHRIRLVNLFDPFSIERCPCVSCAAASPCNYEIHSNRQSEHGVESPARLCLRRDCELDAGSTSLSARASQRSD
eukprot:4889691-Pleurochrysis_carterae.AAC.1